MINKFVLIKEHLKFNKRFEDVPFVLFIAFLVICLYSKVISICYASPDQGGKPLRAELVWYQYLKCYKDLSDVKEGLAKGDLVHPPEFFKELNILNKGVGDIDPENASYYWSAKPGTLGLLLSITKEYRLRLKDRNARICVSGLLRTLEYQNILSQYNNWADLGRSTHTNGATFDITVHPLYMHNDIKKIDTLVSIFRELHKKGEVFFIDEASNSCLHVCLHPDYEKKYASIFYNICREYDLSSCYASNGTRFTSFKNNQALKDGLSSKNLISLKEMSKDFSLPANKPEEYLSLRPETTGLLMEVNEHLKSELGNNFVLPLSELVRTSEEQKKIVADDPLLPVDSPFIYGAAFQIDGSKLTEQEFSALKKELQQSAGENNIIFIERDGNKYDVSLKPSAIPKYNLLYQKSLSSTKGLNLKRYFSFKPDFKYLYITSGLLIFLLFAFISYRFYRLRMLISKLKKLRKKKKIRIKRKEMVILSATNTFTPIEEYDRA